MASVNEDVAAYEEWLHRQCAVVEADLAAKHRRMRKSAFDFLRATYFRWAKTIETTCPNLASAPMTLCIGDIHVENYGTWRDAEARLVWGVNDFDEAAVMPYAFDLVRLATSAMLVPDLGLAFPDATAALVKGYRRSLLSPGAILLDENQAWLRGYANPTEKSNGDFWQELEACADANPPPEVKAALVADLPAGAQVQRFASRTKGGGSLGRPRFLAMALWKSGRVVREAKALVPSAWSWAHDADEPNRLLEAASGTFRSPDPFLRVAEGFVLRRLAPDSRKIEIAEVQAQGVTADLLETMGGDLGSVHAAGAMASGLLNDLDSRPKHWLLEAALTAKAATSSDFATYRDLAG